MDPVAYLQKKYKENVFAEENEAVAGESSKTTRSNSAKKQTRAGKRLLDRDTSATCSETSIETDETVYKTVDVDQLDEENTENYEVVPLKRIRISSVEYNRPADLMTSLCFDSSGRLLSRDECDANLREAMRNKRNVDYYSLLEEGAREGVQGTIIEEALKCIAYNSVMINGIMSTQDTLKNSRKSLVKLVEFDLEAAKAVDELCYLPGHKAVKLTSFMSEQMCTTWSCKDIASGTMMLVRETMEKVAEMDPIFIYYTAPKSSRITKYLRISNSVLSKFADVLISGFKSPADASTRTTTIKAVIDSISNLIDRKRYEFKERHGCKKFEEGLALVYQETAENPFFREDEPPLIGEDF